MFILGQLLNQHGNLHRSLLRPLHQVLADCVPQTELGFGLRKHRLDAVA